ncbi:type II toxin-antitoxin system ParD family antitoxin [Pararhizobium sp.]|uniref:type II toxin-antitoxin system ParD family antitoxin n=1 Tax=Pararhizobium sp. TaxID=1977563 RepID=UPI0027248DE4|nr:type II toxin-antitoxin system ParD family antitoxin [Pararhizobium sp.]MDO9417547.1 type II toxin-antitoxin system ParD family antitoxin [Pararhizobium sp.]
MSNAKKSFVIGDHFDAFIAEKVASGRFNNASEVVRAGLRLLERDEAKMVELRKLIQAGEDDIAAGRVFEYDSADALLADIKSGEFDN